MVVKFPFSQQYVRCVCVQQYMLFDQQNQYVTALFLI